MNTSGSIDWNEAGRGFNIVNQFLSKINTTLKHCFLGVDLELIEWLVNGGKHVLIEHVKQMAQTFLGNALTRNVRKTHMMVNLSSPLSHPIYRTEVALNDLIEGDGKWITFYRNRKGQPMIKYSDGKWRIIKLVPVKDRMGSQKIPRSKAPSLLEEGEELINLHILVALTSNKSVIPITWTTEGKHGSQLRRIFFLGNHDTGISELETYWLEGYLQDPRIRHEDQGSNFKNKDWLAVTVAA